MKNKSITIPIIPIIIFIIIVFAALIGMKGIKKQEINTDKQNLTIVAKGVTFEVNDVVANLNDEITISIKMLEDSNFVAANFELLYDSSQMQYINYEEGEILEKGAMSIVNNDEENDKILIAFVANPQNESDLIEKGELLSITFKMNNSINDIEIMPEFKCTTLKDKYGNDIQSVINQGTISFDQK